MLRVGSGFTGIGAWESAFKRKGIPHKLEFFIENDKYPATSFCAIHNVDESLNYNDITKLNGDEVPDIDIFVYSPPCQSWSVAGKQLGLEDKRGVLFFDALRIIDKKRPYICIMENVKNLAGKKFKNEFQFMLDGLTELGYKNYWQILNLKDYGLPQNRQRVILVSIREDIDDGQFEFPKPFDSGLRLKDILEDEVDEKYYISDDKVKRLLAQLISKNKENIGLDKENNVIMIESQQEVKVRKYEVDTNKLKEILKIHKQSSKLSNKQISDELNVKQTTVEHWFRQDSCFSIPEADVWIQLKELLKIKTDEFDKSIIEFEIKEGVYEKSNRFYSDRGIAPTLTTGNENKIIESIVCEQRSDEGLRFFKDNVCGSLRTIDACGDKRILESNYRIRKLTPLECFRLQGFTDEEFYKAKEALNNTYYKGKDKSNSQLYKQAGNSIGVTKLMCIYESLQPYFDKINELNNNK